MTDGAASLITVISWATEVEELIKEAEALCAWKPPAGMRDAEIRRKWAELGDQWYQLCFLAVHPWFVLASARASLAAQVPVLLPDAAAPKKVRVKPEKVGQLWDEIDALEEASATPGDLLRAEKQRRDAQELSEKQQQEKQAQKLASYMEKRAAEEEAAKQAETERRAKVLAIAAATPAVAPEPEPQPVEALEVVEVEPAADADEGPIWVSAEELARVLGITGSFLALMRREEVFSPDISEKRGKGYWYDLEAARRAFADRPLKRKSRARPPAELPPPMPVTIEPLEPQGPAVEPEAPMPGADDAQAVLELVGDDPAVLEALQVLLQQLQKQP